MVRINRYNLIHYLFFCAAAMICSCKSKDQTKPAPAGPGVSGANCKPQRITAIYKDYVYDLSGYEDVAGGNTFNLFDEAGFVDPKKLANINPHNPQTSPHPPSGIVNYFKDHGSRIVVDLRVPYKLSEIYLFDRARQMDSVYVYTGTMQKWKLVASFATKGDISQWGWRKLTVTDSTRFVQFRFRSPEAEITEAVLYGCALGTPPPPPPAQYTGERLPPKMMKEFLGVNCFQETPTRFMKPFYYSRIYTYNSLIDPDTVNKYPNIKYNITPHGWYNNGINDYVLYVDSMKQMGNKSWYSYLGVPKWMEIKGYQNFDRPVTAIGMDSEDPMSYARHANMFWNMAACYGTTPVDTSLLQAWNEHKFTGRNVMTLYENGNENDAYWANTRYCNPMEYFAQSTADYDGHEGRMGNRHGIKKADANSELMMAGFTSFDINRLKTLKFLCNTLRSDSQFLWTGGIQYHYYSSDGKGNNPGKMFMNSRAGITPEEDSLRQKLAKAREATYRIQPDVEVFLGEYGYDKSRASKVSAPLVPGYNQAQSQGIMLVRAINAIAFSGIDRYIIYWIKDDGDENHPAMFVTSGLLRQHGATYTPYPAWYYISTLVHHLGNYIPEKVVSEQGKVWVYKYRNKISPDSAAYFVYCPTRNGSKTDYDLAVTVAPGTSATEISFAEHSVTGAVASKAAANGKLRLQINEVPKLVVVKER
jgi:hypothetical protein